MRTERGSRRLRERLNFSLPARVHARESASHEWTETTRLIDVTPFGARLRLRHPTERGRLLHLTIPLPRQLRCFDHAEPQYRVWALVRHVRAYYEDGQSRFEIGVAFIGKRPPESFLSDPTQRYEPIDSSRGDGMIAVRAQSEDTRSDRTRLIVPLEVILELLDDDGRAFLSEATVTENISPEGAAVFSTLEIEPGRFVRLRDAHRPDFALVAAVRARHVGPNGLPRLHLEFIDGRWPIEGLT
jgi:hypothetical protein